MKQILLIAFAAAFLGGCCSTSSEKPKLQRGWIGGEYRKTERRFVPAGEHAKIYVKQVYSETPAAEAGLQSGDLILAVNDQPVGSLKQFRRLVDTTAPGNRVAIRILRDGNTLELPVTAGRETYQEWHALTLGLGLSGQLDLWPDPDFAVMPLGRYKRSEDRVELRAPEIILARQARREKSHGEPGARSDEGWDFWLVVFGFNSHRRILSQETGAFRNTTDNSAPVSSLALSRRNAPDKRN